MNRRGKKDITVVIVKRKLLVMECVRKRSKHLYHYEYMGNSPSIVSAITWKTEDTLVVFVLKMS